MPKRSVVSLVRSRTRLPLVDKGDAASAVFVAGTGRSGTTWVAELINHANDFRVVFEPFHPVRSHPSLQLAGRPFPVPGSPSPLDDYLDSLLSGAFRSQWTDQYNDGFVYERRLIKAIRANLMLPWITDRHPDLRTILVIRNPVLNSVSRLQGGWPAPIEYFDSRAVRSLHPAIDEYVATADALDEWQRTVAFWCIENLVALSGIRNAAASMVVAHEELVVAPDESLSSMLTFASVGAMDDVKQRRARPSSMVRKGQTVASTRAALDARMAAVEPDRHDAAAKIVAAFGLNELYERSALPATPPSEWPDRVPQA